MRMLKFFFTFNFTDKSEPTNDKYIIYHRYFIVFVITIINTLLYTLSFHSRHLIVYPLFSLKTPYCIPSLSTQDTVLYILSFHSRHLIVYPLFPLKTPYCIPSLSTQDTLLYTLSFHSRHLIVYPLFPLKTPYCIPSLSTQDTYQQNPLQHRALSLGCLPNHTNRSQTGSDNLYSCCSPHRSHTLEADFRNPSKTYTGRTSNE